MDTAAPMETKAEAVEADQPPFPLECFLCPKKPVFSDSSHLLTHISSKAHLHQKFSMEFKAKSDDGIRDRLQRYEHWYAEYDIERLLSERLATKGIRKQPSRRVRASTNGVSSCHHDRQSQ